MSGAFCLRTVCSFLFFWDGHCVSQEQLEGGTRAAKRRAATASVSLMRRWSHRLGVFQRRFVVSPASLPSCGLDGLFDLTFSFRQMSDRDFVPVVFSRAEGSGAGTAAGHCIGGDALMSSLSCFSAGGASFMS